MPITEIEHNPWEAAGAVAAPAGQISDVAHNPWETPSLATDVAKSAGSGLAGGLVGAASMTPTIIGAATKGIMKLNEMAGNPLSYISPGGTGVDQAEANKRVIAQATGRPSYDYTPQTTLGGYAKGVGEFGGATLGAGLPGIGGTPGQIAKQVAGQVVAPAVASEAAGQATKGTEAEPYARVGAGLLTGAAGAVLTGGPAGVAGLTRQQVKANAAKAYQSPELKNVEFAPPSTKTLAGNLEADLTAQNFSAPKASEAFNAINNLKSLDNPTLANVRAIDQALSRTAREVGPNGLSTSDAAAATIIKKGIRNYLDNISQGDLVAGDASKIGPILRNANQDYAAQAAAFELPKVMKQAQAYAKKYDIPISEALDVKGKSLTPDERAQAIKAIQGNFATKSLQAVGMLDPTKNPLALAAHGISAISTGGATLPISSAGTAAGRLAEIIRASQIRQLRNDILKRSATAQSLPPAPRSIGVIPRTLVGAARGGYGGLLGLPYSPQQ